MRRTAFLLLLLVVSLSRAAAEERPVTISGTVFGDYYAVASHHDPVAEGKNGFWIRRGYVTFDRAMSDALSARLRFEVNQPGDFRTNATLEPYVKDAYVKWRSSQALEVVLGLSPTPGFETVERIWGYRSVEKSPLDLHRIVATRDLGVAAMGSYGRMRYHVIAGNGAGTGSETNEGKRIAASAALTPTSTTVLEVYADYEDRPGATNRMTLQAFGGVDAGRYNAGVQFAHQTREGANDLDIGSLFATFDLSERFTLLGRIDRLFDPNPDGDRIPYLPFDRTREATMLIAGVDWKLHKNLSIIPNVEYVAYDGDADDDLLPRVTFSFTF